MHDFSTEAKAELAMEPSAAFRFCGMVVDCRVQRRVVIHFELAVKLEASPPLHHLLPQMIERLGEVGALFRQDAQALTIALLMTRW